MTLGLFLTGLIVLFLIFVLIYVCYLQWCGKLKDMHDGCGGCTSIRQWLDSCVHG